MLPMFAGVLARGFKNQGLPLDPNGRIGTMSCISSSDGWNCVSLAELGESTESMVVPYGLREMCQAEQV